MKSENPISRRSFIAVVTGTVAFLTGILATLGSAVFQFLSPGVLAEPAQRMVLKDMGEYPVDEATFVELGTFYLMRTRNDVYALSSRCPHLGCRVKWNSSARSFDCPCHGSSFDREGVPLTGPAVRSLLSFEVTRDRSGRLVVDKEHSSRKLYKLRIS